MSYSPVNPQINFFDLEEEISAYWKKNRTFEKSIENRADAPVWNFLDGPPFITGLPHYGSLLSSIPKDVFPRFWTMKGKKVRRVWGWDCHGLPAENKVENKLGITRKRDIEDVVGVKKFIDECKLYVREVSSEWEWYIDHIARWVDMKNAYKTMDTPYMESVMWVFKSMYDKGAIYKGLRVSLYCPHCSTPISNFEVAMDPDNYKEVTEPSNIYKFKLLEEKDTSFLAWSTTPWNKIVTVALAVNPQLRYVQVKEGNEHFILAHSALKLLKSEYTLEKEFLGKDLLGIKYEPHFSYFPIQKGRQAHLIVSGDFVTEDEGTGIVTIAAYGAEDLEVIQKEQLQIMIHVDDEGMIKKDIPTWGDRYYLKINDDVNADLLQRGLLYAENPHAHSIPTCWRCHTRLYYSPQDAWYVRVSDMKQRLKKTNEPVKWFPEHFKNGRFEKSLEAAPDWCISRSRYWGSPVPVWDCECGERFVPGSIAELEKESGQKITDLHKPEIDDVEITCHACQKKVKRVTEVLDSWIEAGSAAFAERHFPFDESLKLDDFFPPDFITEYTGQIRAWFYVLHVISTILYEKNAFKNVLVTGVILGTDGRKMSKNYGNYPDPKEMIRKYGGDALRLYLMGSSVLHGEDILISEQEYHGQVRGFLLIFWNIYNFFVTNASVDGWTHTNKTAPQSSSVLDRWILSRLNGFIRELSSAYERYDLPEAVSLARTFVVRDVSSWYIRRIRERIGAAAPNGADKDAAYQTLWSILTSVSKALAPLIPFITEEIYRNLTGEESVHLASWWDDAAALQSDTVLEKSMDNAIKLASVTHAFRKEASVKVRIPFRELEYSGPEELSPELLSIILTEVNAEKFLFSKKQNDYTVTGDTSEANQDLEMGVARELVRSIQEQRKLLGTKLTDHVDVVCKNWPTKYEDYMKRRALIRNLTRGEEFSVVRAE